MLFFLRPARRQQQDPVQQPQPQQPQQQDQEKIPGKISFDLAPKRRRVLRAAAAAALLNGLGLGGCFIGGGGGDGQEESDEEDEERRLGWCLSGVVDIRLNMGRIRRLLPPPPPLLPSVDGVPIASALRDLQPNIGCLSDNVHQSFDFRFMTTTKDDQRRPRRRQTDKTQGNTEKKSSWKFVFAWIQNPSQGRARCWRILVQLAGGDWW